MARVDLQSLWQRVESQKQENPAIYGNVDFSVIPERFAATAHDHSTISGKYEAERAALLADSHMMEFIRAYSLMGDRVADAYAGLMREYGFRQLVEMLTEACDKGVESVPDAPPELVAFIHAMEQTPDWLDMEMVEEGARLDRNSAANMGPFIIRGAFIATFINKYAALPMAITNTLSSGTSARRVKETATFFSTSVLPGALERFGPGFKSAAMVRLMHSMVRANVMRRPKDWDLGVYGIPIPQVDQMPAGLITIFLLSYKLLRQGRTEFNRDERAKVELSRYRCFLLGLPEDLLADTPQGIVDLMTARGGTLRAGFDDSTCGELLRSTMAADLRPDNSLKSRIYGVFEMSFSKLFFLKSFLEGDEKKARDMGVYITPTDKLLAAIAGVFVFGRLFSYAMMRKIPLVRDWADRRLVRKIKNQLASYGHAEFTTDASQYRAAPQAVPAE